jgi:phosphatidylinositol alpha-1,6-mannosyltransferase
MSRSVLFLALSAYSGTGGMQRFNRRIIDALADAGPRTAYLLHDRADDLPGDPTGLTAFGSRRLGFVRRSLAAARTADTLLLGHINLLPLGWLAKRLNPRLKLMLFAHGIEVWDDPQYRRRRFHEPAMLHSLDCVAAVSRHTAGRMQHAFGLAETRFAILPNAVDGPVTARPAPPSNRTLLTVSRMAIHDRAKNLDAVIRAFATLDTGATLEIVGDGVLRPELEALAAELGVTDRVRFLGHVDEEALAACYARASTFVLPSSKEGFGIVYLEAWRHGVPVIGASEGAASEIISDGIDGFVVDPRDIGQVTDRMSALLDDPDRALAMGNAGAAKIAARYLDAHFRNNLAALLEAL